MHFRLKIFTATLAILLCTLVLNSVLSIASFEKIYSRSLLSIMESAGINLKQDIERGILLGKPLDAFEGMQEMLRDFLNSNPRLKSVAVSIDDAEIAYLEASKDHGIISEQDNIASFEDKAQKTAGPEVNDMQLLARHARKNHKQKETVTSFAQGYYLIYIPLFQRSEDPVGSVLLSFSQQVILERVWEMAWGALTRLGWFLGLTAVVLIFVLAFFVVRPIRNDLQRIRQGLLPFIQEPKARPEAPADQDAELENDAALNQEGERIFSNSADPVRPGQLDLPYRFPDSRKIRNDIINLGAYLQEVALELESGNVQTKDSAEYSAQDIAQGLKSCNQELTAYLSRSLLPFRLRNELKAIIRENEQAIQVLQAGQDLPLASRGEKS